MNKNLILGIVLVGLIMWYMSNDIDRMKKYIGSRSGAYPLDDMTHDEIKKVHRFMKVYMSGPNAPEISAEVKQTIDEINKKYGLT